MEEVRFDTLGISENILKAITDRGFVYPTKIQAEAIPPMLEWKDVIAKAPTGTGKTFAFGIPIIQHIEPKNKNIQALVLAPTRELAIQITEELRSLMEFCPGIKTVCLYGGQKIDNQLRNLSKKPQIVVATPGRLSDHIKRQSVNLDSVKTLVLDEADRMVDMGFVKDVTKIINLCKNRTNLALFSATISQEVLTISWKFQRDEVEITVPADKENKPDIEQFSIESSATAKIETTMKLLNTLNYERVMIFCNTKHMAAALYESIKDMSFTVECLHGDILQKKRNQVMEQFKAGNLNVLIATDVASRGIDVDDVECVINFDLPEDNEFYIHRIGRTGRAKRRGQAYTIFSSILDKAKLDEIAKYSHFTVTPMRFSESGGLEPVPPKPTVKKRLTYR